MRFLSILIAMMLSLPAFCAADSADDFLNQLRDSELTPSERKKIIVDSVCQVISRDYAAGLISADSMLILAKYHEPYSPLISECCLKAILTADNIEAITALSRYYLIFPEFKEKNKDGWRLLRKAVEDGNNKAYIYYGHVNYKDNKYDTALEYFSKADCDNHPTALDDLGMMYMRGRGVDVDKTKAVKYLTKASMLGNRVSQNTLGMHFSDYANPNPDYEEAFKWLYISADLGYDPSRIVLHLPRSFDLGLVTLPEPAEFAMVTLAALLKDEVMENTPRYRFGFKKLLQRENQIAANDDFISFFFGGLYYNGDFVERNADKAARYYGRIIDRNKLPDNMMALVYYRMSKLLANGDGLPADPEKSQAYLQKAARLGCLPAYLEVEQV